MRQVFESVQERHPFKIEAWVLLPDHLHCLWTLPPGDTDYSTRWMLVKSRFTRECTDPSRSAFSVSRERKREQYVWQRRFWEHQIRDERDFKAHVEYIHYNPVKHGLVASPKNWPHSSFHRYVRRVCWASLCSAQPTHFIGVMTIHAPTG
ncbi:MAG: transposase [Nitrospirae bacterium]|nr:transposase [Nitrospirota bacterium]